MTPTTTPTVTVTEHGTYTHGKPRRGEGGWYRIDQWAGNTGTMAADIFHTAGPDDDTPRHPLSSYDPECSWCWLGYSHTEAAHAKEAGR